ncbi:MAG: ORF6N domain-containing protein [Clostridium sp.]|uniref:ORF6N domain-containing protein n=1 Tax=Clostridium sp. TaxID=1506 RepID=UPI002901BB00|nr:ORF6N domain-containing protein [Clostridium sp.]MDU1311696.1 ORF6N domain-containing protein [Clostridium sp.]MDU1408847.1 ORF6N domain-containing protein [Clostridium sp.]
MNNLTPLEFKNQRIITTKVLAEEFGTEEGNIQKNYSRNEKRFLEGKHYYKLGGQALKEFKNSLPTESLEPIKFAPVLYLWTDRGAARHAKILDTDEAWEVYEDLEENYFNPKEKVQALNTFELSPELQMFKQIFDTVAKQELENKQIKAELEKTNEKVEETKEEIQGIRDVVAINTSTISWREECRKLIVKMAHSLGGNRFIGDVNREVYGLMRIRLKCKLDVQLTNMRRRMADEGVCKSKRDNLNYLDVIARDSRLIEGYVAIVKELAIKYGI